MPARFFIDQPLAIGTGLVLPAGPARHVQVLRLQPGSALTLFDGRGGEWAAQVTRIGRTSVEVEVLAHEALERELDVRVTLAVGMPANERMDLLVEKATELGVASIQPLHCERSVLRLSGDRALKKVAHWQAVAVAACEQSGRTRVPKIEAVCALSGWLDSLAAASEGAVRVVMSPTAAAGPAWPPGLRSVVGLSGPEGGLSAAEEAAARRTGFVAVALGPRVLRADTAPLALLAHLAIGGTAAG
jgi:16S rRNA (uracil1498-N3)-methyltransferase